MSRSKRQAIFVCGYGNPGKKIDKRIASKSVRNYKLNISDGGFYKKISSSYDIADYKFDCRWDYDLEKFYHVHFINDRYYQNK